jgi:hypothetical protein
MLEVNEAWDTVKDPRLAPSADAQLALRRVAARPQVRQAIRARAGRSDHRRSPWVSGSAARPQKGPVLDFGRYKGWTLDQIGRQDRDFLEWLQRHPAGRLYRVELEQLLGHPSR